MSLTVKLKENDEIVTLNAATPLEIIQDLTTELDNGSVSYYRTENDYKGTVEPLAPYYVTVISQEGGGLLVDYFDFVGIDSRAIVSRGENNNSLYKHSVNLTEPTKLLEGVLIDGFGVAQPEEYANRKTLLQVVTRLLAVTALRGSALFTLTNDARVRQVLSEVKSPEFKWGSQATLSECLMQIAQVVDALPRLIRDSDNNFTIVTFDFINDYSNEVSVIMDGYSNTFGENTEENQYNTALGAVVENVREK